MADTDSVSFTFRLPRDLRDAFSARLEYEDQTASQVLRRAIRAYLGGGVAPAVAPASYTPPPAPVAVTPEDEEPPAEDKPRSLLFEGLRRNIGFSDDDEEG